MGNISPALKDFAVKLWWRMLPNNVRRVITEPVLSTLFNVFWFLCFPQLTIVASWHRWNCDLCGVDCVLRTAGSSYYPLLFLSFIYFFSHHSFKSNLTPDLTYQSKIATFDVILDYKIQRPSTKLLTIRRLRTISNQLLYLFRVDWV